MLTGMYRLAIGIMALSMLGCGFKNPNPDKVKDMHYRKQVAVLQALMPDSIVKHTPNDYWFYNGKQDVLRLPLVWPYSIYSVNGLGNARLYDDRLVTDYKNAGKQPLMQELEYLKEFSFDGKMMLAHTSTNGGFLNNNKNPMERWVIFMFYNKDVYDCDNEGALFIKAKTLGYTGSQKLISIQDYSLLFN